MVLYPQDVLLLSVDDNRISITYEVTWDQQSYCVLAELLGRGGTETGPEMKNRKGRSYTLFPVSLRIFSTERNFKLEGMFYTSASLTRC